MLNVIDEFTRECLAIRIDRKLNSTAVIDVLTDLFILRGVPGHVRSDNGPEFIAKAVRGWIDAVGAKRVFIEPGSPLSGHRHAMPCRAVHGRTATAKASTRSSAPLGRLLCNRLPGNGRAVKRGDILLPRRSPRGDRGVARPLQYRAATLVAGISAARAGSRPLAFTRRWFVSASGNDDGTKARHALRLKPDHPIGAGQATLGDREPFKRKLELRHRYARYQFSYPS